MTDPHALFAEWFAEARAAEPSSPEAMALATADADGQPAVRMLLLKDHDPRGFTFYTNFESRKAKALLANPRASILFHWKSLQRQIRIEGRVERVSAEEADAYFASRARESQIGAWASDQSRPLDSRALFEARYQAEEARFAGGPVPRPPYWSGFRLVPRSIEFWRERPYRLHERRLFTRSGDGWDEGLLYP